MIPLPPPTARPIFCPTPRSSEDGEGLAPPPGSPGGPDDGYYQLIAHHRAQETLYSFDNCTCRPCQIIGSGYNSPCYNQWTIWPLKWTYLHSGGGNLLMMDGHVEYRLALSLVAGDFGWGVSEPLPTSGALDGHQYEYQREQ